MFLSNLICNSFYSICCSSFTNNAVVAFIAGLIGCALIYYGFSAISKQASEATPEHWDQVFAQFPHLATEEALARAEQARAVNLYGSTQCLPAGLVAVDQERLALLLTQIKATIRGIRKAAKTGTWPMNLFHCTECPHLGQCIHHIEPEEPGPESKLTLAPERVNLHDALAYLEAKNAN